MIKAYLLGIPSYHELDDIEIRYSIYEDEQLVAKESIVREYKKPGVVNLLGLIALLKELEKYIGKDITIIVNDENMNNQIAGTYKTASKDIKKVAGIASEKLEKFEGKVTIIDVSNKKEQLERWKNEL